MSRYDIDRDIYQETENQYNKNKLITAKLPLIKTNESTNSIYADLIIALMPLLIMGIFFYGMRALVISIISILSAQISSLICSLMRKRSPKFFDLSSVFIGFSLAMLLSPVVPIWIPIIGSCFAVFIGRGVFGGLGQNPFSPTAVGYAFLAVSFRNEMYRYVLPSNVRLPLFKDVIAEAVATPASMLKLGGVPIYSLEDMVYGFVPSAIGTSSIVALVATLFYLIYRKAIPWQIPASFVFGMFLCTLTVSSIIIPNYKLFLYEIMSGSFLFSAIFVATDYASSPKIPFARLLFGFIIGALSYFIFHYGAVENSALFAILIVNGVYPWLDMIAIRAGKRWKWIRRG